MFRSILLIIIQAGFISMIWGQTGQDLRFEKISVNDGLSQSTGRIVIQDSKGFIWIGTQDGLNKYDGRSFMVYNYDPQDINSLADNFIQDITEDDDGILWIGYNTGGMDCFDPDNEIFSHYKNLPGDTTSISNNFIIHIYIDRAGTIWVGTANGANIFNPETGAFRRINLSGIDDSTPFINCFNEDR